MFTKFKLAHVWMSQRRLAKATWGGMLVSKLVRWMYAGLMAVICLGGIGIVTPETARAAPAPNCMDVIPKVSTMVNANVMTAWSGLEPYEFVTTLSSGLHIAGTCVPPPGTKKFVWVYGAGQINASGFLITGPWGRPSYENLPQGSSKLSSGLYQAGTGYLSCTGGDGVTRTADLGIGGVSVSSNSSQTAIDCSPRPDGTVTIAADISPGTLFANRRGDVLWTNNLPLNMNNGSNVNYRAAMMIGSGVFQFSDTVPALIPAITGTVDNNSPAWYLAGGNIRTWDVTSFNPGALQSCTVSVDPPSIDFGTVAPVSGSAVAARDLASPRVAHVSASCTGKGTMNDVVNGWRVHTLQGLGGSDGITPSDNPSVGYKVTLIGALGDRCDTGFTLGCSLTVRGTGTTKYNVSPGATVDLSVDMEVVPVQYPVEHLTPGRAGAVIYVDQFWPSS